MEHVCDTHRPPEARKPALHAQSPRLVDPAAARPFAGQAVHVDAEFAPVAVEYVFGPHWVQFVDPGVAAYVPAGQGVHRTPFGGFAYAPGTHVQL